MSAFHAGETAIQQRAGFGEQVASVGQRFIRDAMPEQHQQFFAQLPFALLGVLDAQGYPRAGVLAGVPGFLSAPDAGHLEARGAVVAGAGVSDGLRPGEPFGLLGIEAHTRRRNRLNGWVMPGGGDRLRLQVAQSFGNCPKYIHPRRAEWAPVAAGVRQEMPGWDAAARRIVAAADTFFIASAHPQAAHAQAPAHGVDVSHRGGEPGFVHIDGATLRVPDYPGNRFFNTLGNLELNPWAGLLFIDFGARELLQLTVRARIEWLPPPDATPTRPERVLQFEIVKALRTVGGLPLVWRAP